MKYSDCRGSMFSSLSKASKITGGGPISAGPSGYFAWRYSRSGVGWKVSSKTSSPRRYLAFSQLQSPTLNPAPRNLVTRRTLVRIILLSCSTSDFAVQLLQYRFVLTASEYFPGFLNFIFHGIRKPILKLGLYYPEHRLIEPFL